jgi:fermentation-respiration switch protein FrsA (DUF1100 family)
VSLVIIAPVGLSIYVGSKLTHPAREPVSVTPQSVGLAFESIAFQSRQGGIELKGWYLPASSASTKAVVMAHGYERNRLQTSSNGLQIAAFLVKAGYNVVMFDFRGQGESGGDVETVGALEKFDLAAAVDWTKAKGNQQIALLGFSMGAGTSLQVAAEEPAVTVVIADSPYSDLKGFIDENLPHWSGLPSFPFTPLITTTIPLLTGADLKAVSPVRAAPSLAKKPMLLIHGDADPDIPSTESEKILQAYTAAGGTQGQLITFAGAAHVRSYTKDPARYEQTVLAFLGQYLK